MVVPLPYIVQSSFWGEEWKKLRQNLPWSYRTRQRIPWKVMKYGSLLSSFSPWARFSSGHWPHGYCACADTRINGIADSFNCHSTIFVTHRIGSALIQLTLFLIARILILVQSLAELMNAPFGEKVLSLPNPIDLPRSFSPFACYSLKKNGIR